MRKTKLAVAGVVALTTSLTMVGVAGAQDGDASTTTSAAPATTAAETTAATTTEVAPTTTTATPDTTAAPTETTAVPAPAVPGDLPVDQAPEADPGLVLDAIELPGNVITSGTLEFNVSFAESPSSGCNGTVALSSGQMNVGYDEAGRVGGMYGLTSTGSGTLGALIVGLGPIPAGVAVLSVSDANCEFDAIGIGSWAATAASATFGGIGFGLHPGAYETGAYIDRISAKANVGATGGAASLDFEQLETFLLRDRPGLSFDIPLPGGNEIPAEGEPAATPPPADAPVG